MTFPRSTNKNGFAVPLKPDTKLGLAMLMVECGDGTYQPIAVVETLKEAYEMAAEDMRVRTRNLDAGETPACPEMYVVWARGTDGTYLEAGRIEP